MDRQDRTDGIEGRNRKSNKEQLIIIYTLVHTFITKSSYQFQPRVLLLHGERNRIRLCIYIYMLQKVIFSILFSFLPGIFWRGVYLSVIASTPVLVINSVLKLCCRLAISCGSSPVIGQFTGFADPMQIIGSAKV